MTATSVSAADLVNSFNFVNSPYTSQIQNLTVTRESVVQTLFLNCKARIIQVAQSIHEITPDEVASLKDNDQHWKQEKKTKENFKLGDRVVIKSKIRQLKQEQQECDLPWDDLVKQDLGQVGTVVSFLPDGVLEPVVFFHKSGRQRAINPTALSKALDKNDDEALHTSVPLKSDTDDAQFLGEIYLSKIKSKLNDLLKRPSSTDYSVCKSSATTAVLVGDQVKLAFESGIVETLQSPLKCPWQHIVAFQDFLGKIISFDTSGYAYVGVGTKLSLLINPLLLKPSKSETRKTDTELELNVTPNQAQKKFPMHSDVIVTSNIKNQQNILKKQFGNGPWNYKLTEIFGAKGKVTYHGINGDIGVTIKEKTYILPHTMLEKKEQRNKREKKKGQKDRHAPYVDKTFPYAINDLVLLGFAHQSSFERILESLRLPSGFAHVCQKPALFLGYSSPTTSVVLLNGFRIQVDTLDLWPISALKGATERIAKQFELQSKKRNAIKVGDDVQIDIDLLVMHWCAPRGLPTVDEQFIRPLELVAFDDAKDLAILKCNEKFLSVGSQFITCAQDTQKTSNAPEDAIIVDDGVIVVMQDVINDISECVKVVTAIQDILKSLGFSFEPPQIIAFAGMSTADFTLKAQTDDPNISELKAQIKDKLSCEFSQDDSVLTFTTLSKLVTVKMNFIVTPHAAEMKEEKSPSPKLATDSFSDQIECQPSTSAAVEGAQDIPQEQIEIESVELPVSAADDNESDDDEIHENQNPPATSLNGTIHQNVSFSRSTREIVVQCRLDERAEEQPLNPNALQPPNPLYSRQNSSLTEGNVGRNTYIFNHGVCNVGNMDNNYYLNN